MRRVLKYILVVFAAVVLMQVAFVSYLYFSADMRQPCIEVDTALYRVSVRDGFRECNDNYLRHSDSGLWEMYLHGNAIDRGTAFGRLTEDLLYYQEKVFVDQIKMLVPSDKYLGFLRFFLVLFNRNLGDAVPEEYREEIYGVSLSATHEFDLIGSPYERQLNYHAAHDIGHTMQDYMLVGCSSFAVWGPESADSSLLIGRNFDFWAGDGSAENKLVSFFAPENGHRFVSVGWPGMSGVLSGMNDKGLTVTINAAKGSVPLSAATPISILAREILQYASTIDEAYEIALSRKTFVSESLLIGSAADRSAAVIEKTPRKTSLYRSASDRLVVTNHYQSAEFGEDKHNIENIAGTDSKYRWDRINQLLDEYESIDETKAAAILRDRRGLGGADIGLTNEKSINQYISHHSVIFKPEELKVWVSAGPWQSGQYVCYDLGEIFAADGPDFSRELSCGAIEADSVFLAGDYARVLLHRDLTRLINDSEDMIPLSVAGRYVDNNPMFFEVYSTLGDHYKRFGEVDLAKENYRRALELEIPTLARRTNIEKALRKLK